MPGSIAATVSPGRSCPNGADAADATQDGLVAAWRQLPRLREPAAFDGWLNRIVANAALSVRRRRGRIREVSVRTYPDDELATGTSA
jgi:DNA-directed RNA polymerase specialized sigma24 family protein